MAVPVFPDVGSISVAPGFSLPSFSASTTIRRATLSLMLPPGLKYSHFTSVISHAVQQHTYALLALVTKISFSLIFPISVTKFVT